MKEVEILSPQEAMQYVQTGMSVMVGGFGLVGSPLTLIQALIERDVTELTILSNNIGESGKGLGKLLQQGKIKKAIGSYFTSNRDVVRLYNEKKLEVELLPQGTFVEAIRAGGAGLGGFYTKTGVGTKIAENKKIEIIDGKEYLFQKSLQADIAIIRAWKADRAGNLLYYKTARNFNPNMATAAKFVIAEVDEIVEIGDIQPDEIITPHLYIDALVKSEITIYDLEEK
ncbi:CoA transferase subunit A [Metasolibacillus sp. FSL H7-0170]|uniref:CoA transferase subunit A n=1 Tax=Metasolibacillus TaxID=2703677 RepID=UPI000D3813E9|nr:CoA transferase subunit A [Metasolibacillus fluoroglycofenilyticus]